MSDHPGAAEAPPPPEAPRPPVVPPVPPAYPGTAPPAPHAPPRRSRTGLWVGLGVGVGVVGVVVVVSLLVLSWSGATAGASSPQAAVDEMVEALRNRDIATALAGVAPGELAGLDQIWRDTQAKTSELGADSPEVTGDALVFEPRTARWDVEKLSANTARVTLAELDMTVGFDAAALGEMTVDQREQLDALGADSVDGTRYTWDVTTDDLPAVTVMTVKRDGGWFVSPLYTVGEYMYHDSRAAQRRGEPDYGYDPDQVGSGADSPSDAVRALAGAAATGTVDDVVALLSPRQLAFAQVYHAFGDGPARESGVSVDELALSEESLGEGRTRVRIDSADIATRKGGLEVDGPCWKLQTRDRTREDCLAGLLPAGSEALAHLLPESVSLVTVEQDGKWYVDPLQSVTTIVGDFVHELGAGDVDQIQNLVERVQELDQNDG